MTPIETIWLTVILVAAGCLLFVVTGGRGPKNRKSENVDACTDQERCRAYFHQMGHAAVALALGEESALSRLGKNSSLHPGFSKDVHFTEKSELKKRIAVLLGGRASEAIFFDEVSTGSWEDLESASKIASAMVRKHGMGQALGLHVERADEGGVNHLSEHTLERVDLEIRGILENAYELACRILEENRTFVEVGADMLLRNKELSPAQLRQLWQESPHEKKMAHESEGGVLKTLVMH